MLVPTIINALREKFTWVIVILCSITTLIILAKRHVQLEDQRRSELMQICVDRVCVEKNGKIIQCFAFNDIYLTQVFAQQSILEGKPAIIYIKLKKKCKSI